MNFIRIVGVLATAGIILVPFRVAWAVQVPMYTLAPSHEIGSADGADEYLFGNIAQLGVGPEGKVYVLDSMLRRLQVFSQAGEYLRTIGRQGYGPGEFQSPWRVAVTSAGWIVVRDLELERYNVYDPEGLYMGARPARNDGSFWDLMRVDTAGRVYDARRSWDDSTSAHMVYSFLPTDTAYLLGGRTLPHWIREMVTLPGGEGYVDQPFRNEFFWTVGPDGTVWTGSGREYLLTGITGEGRLVEVSGEPRRVRIPEARRDSAYAEAAQEVRDKLDGTGHSVRRAIRQLDRREHYPVLLGLHADSGGRLWARMPPGQEDAWIEFEVLDADGTHLASVRFPPERGLEFELLHFGADRVFVPASDPDGAQTVLVFELPAGLRSP